jgi:hypothetical protein
MLQKLRSERFIFPGNAGQPCVGEYTIFLRDFGVASRDAWVFLKDLQDEFPGTSIVNSQASSDSAVRYVIEREMPGVSIDRIRVFFEMCAGDDFGSPWAENPIHRIPVVIEDGLLTTEPNRPADTDEVDLLRAAVSR